MYQGSNLAGVRKLLHEDHENISLLKESCEPTITLIKDIFGHLKLKENYIIPCDVIEDEKVDEFFSDLNLDENISPNEIAKELSEHPLLERYLNQMLQTKVITNRIMTPLVQKQVKNIYRHLALKIALIKFQLTL